MTNDDRLCGCLVLSFCLALTSVWGTAYAQTETEEKSETIAFGNGLYTLTLPQTWEPREPRSSIIQHEFALVNEAGSADGRITMMSAGGTVQANLDRWIDQFLSGEPKQDKREVAEVTIHVLSVEGTYNDKPRPFGPGVKRDDYRMLAAILETPDRGNFFVKCYGPKELIKSGEDDFHACLDSLKRNE